MRLVHLANYPNLHAGSFIPMLTAVMREAQSRGWATVAGFTDIVEGNTWQTGLEATGVDVRLVEPGSRTALTPRVGRILAEEAGPVIVHTHFTTYDLPAAISARRRGDAVVFWHIHTVLRSGPLPFLRNAAKMIPFRRAVDRIVVPADNIGEGLIRRGAPREKVMVLPSPIDPGAFPLVTVEQRTAARAELGLDQDADVLMHIGRAWELKGGDVFLEALKLLRDEGRNVVGMTLRGGAEGEADRDRLGLGDAALVLGRVEDMRVLYAAADCFVAPSRGEGMPFSVVEALASGVPVVASGHLPGHRFLADRVPACLVEEGTPEGMAVGIRKILDRPDEQRDREKAETRTIIEQSLDLGSAAGRLVDDYEEAARARSLI